MQLRICIQPAQFHAWKDPLRHAMSMYWVGTVVNKSCTACLHAGVLHLVAAARMTAAVVVSGCSELVPILALLFGLG